MTYLPEPIDTTDIILSPDLMDLCEKIAKNVHDVWAQERIAQGWAYGTRRNDELMLHPNLVPYEKLKEKEKIFDRNTAIETLKLITKLGFKITK